jgi:hypothetical protein
LTRFFEKIITTRKIIAALLFIFLSPTNSFGEPKGYSEYKIKAGYIYNFARFIKWPEQSFENHPNSFLLCLIEGDPFASQFDKVKGKSITGKKLTIKRLSSQGNLKQCQILFIPTTKRKNMRAIIKSLKNSHVLTVGEVQGFHKLGGMVGLIKKDNQVKLEINLQATKKKELRINAKLLEIATIVNGN